MENTLKKMKMIIIVLSVLLGLSLAALACVLIHGQLNPPEGSAVSPDNVIELADSSVFCFEPVMQCASVSDIHFAGADSTEKPEKIIIDSDSVNGVTISLYKYHDEDSAPFHSANMFPGDAETRAYFIEVSHTGKVTVRFHADIHTGYEKLAEVLKCKVVLREEHKVLYDGLMRDMPASLDYSIYSATPATTELTYDITAYLDTSVGNEYMAKELFADFRWWVEDNESGGGSDDPDDPVTPDDPDEPDDPDNPDNPDNPDVPVIPEDSDKPEDSEQPDDSADPENPAEPANPEKPDDSTRPDDQTGDEDGELVRPPKTGDSSHAGSWLLLMLLSAAGLMILWWKRRENNGDAEDVRANGQ